MVFGRAWAQAMIHDYKTMWLPGKVVGYEHARDKTNQVYAID